MDAVARTHNILFGKANGTCLTLSVLCCGAADGLEHARGTQSASLADGVHIAVTAAGQELVGRADGANKTAGEGV